MKKVANKITKIEGVESVDYGGSNSDQLSVLLNLFVHGDLQEQCFDFVAIS